MNVLQKAIEKDEVRFKDVWRKGMARKTAVKYLRKMIEEKLIEKGKSKITHKNAYFITIKGIEWYWVQTTIKSFEMIADIIFESIYKNMENLKTDDLLRLVADCFIAPFISFLDHVRVFRKFIDKLEEEEMREFLRLSFQVQYELIRKSLYEKAEKIIIELVKRKDFDEKVEKLTKPININIYLFCSNLLKQHPELREKMPEIEDFLKFLKDLIGEKK